MKLYTRRLFRLSCVLGGGVCCYNSRATVGLCAGVTMAFSREELSKATPRELESGATHTTCITAKTSHTYSCGLFKMILQNMHHHTQRESIITHNAWCISVHCLIKKKHWLKWSKDVLLTLCLNTVGPLDQALFTLVEGGGASRECRLILQCSKHIPSKLSFHIYTLIESSAVFIIENRKLLFWVIFFLLVWATAHLCALWC